MDELAATATATTAIDNKKSNDDNMFLSWIPAEQKNSEWKLALSLRTKLVESFDQWINHSRQYPVAVIYRMFVAWLHVDYTSISNIAKLLWHGQFQLES